MRPLNFNSFMKPNISDSATRRKILLVAIIISICFSSIDLSANHDLADWNGLFEDRRRSPRTNGIVNTLVSSDSSVIPTDELDIEHSEAAFDGNNLLVVQRKNETTRDKGLFLVIMDMEGNSLKEKKIGGNFVLADCSAEWINTTTILYGTPQGAVLWNYYTDTIKELNFIGHHEYEYNHAADTIFTFKYDIIEIEEEIYLFDRIVEYNLTGDIVWSLHTNDFISHRQWCPYEDIFLEAPDITHSNTLFFDEKDDVFYYNARNVNTFYKINHTNGEVIWAVGEYGNLTLLDKDGIEQQSLFYHPHAVEEVDANRFILFDNDFHDPQNPLIKQSRMLEIQVDEVAETAQEVWSWIPSVGYWSFIWGDADRLPNGNRLGVFGTHSHPGSSYSARLVEVDEAGNIVWKMDFPKGDGYSYGIYRMERFRYAPTIKPPENGSISAGENVTVTWKTCFNFKPKRDVTGNYSFYLNGALVESGEVNYDRYWLYRELDVELGQLDEGKYNLTLSITDGAGHSTTKSIDLTISSMPSGQFILIIITLACVAGVAVVAYKSDYLTKRLS